LPLRWNCRSIVFGIVFLVGVSVWAAGLSAAPAGAADVLRVQALVSPNGSGRLLVNNGAAPWIWEACAPDRSSCKPFGRGREIKTKGAPSRTVFRVKSHDATGLSPEWHGRLTPVRKPTIGGIIRAHEFVSPIPGQWVGGWKGEFSELQLSACATATGKDCTTLTDPHYVRSCAADASFALGEKFVGAYLRVANRRIGVDRPIRPAFAVTSPYGGDVWEQKRNTSVAVLGQIAAPTQASLGECGPPPPGNALIDEQGHALVDCQGGCRTALVASRKGHQVQVSRTLPLRSALLVTPPAELRLTSRTIQTRLGAGKVHFVVKINGQTAAQRFVLIGNPPAARDKSEKTPGVFLPIHPCRRERPGYYLDKVAESAEDYYSGEGEVAGEWLGDAAEDLGLSGRSRPRSSKRC